MQEMPNERADAAVQAEIARARQQRALAESSIRLAPLELVAISAGVGFMFALLLRV
jgi:ElaB/YqjD/DUF883 family membrane-anchored ribosome-binding protein